MIKHSIKRLLRNTWLVLAACLAAFSMSVLAETSSEPLELMSFNLRYGSADDGKNSWPKRVGLVLDVIERQRPDVLGVQEALDFQLKAIAAANPRFTVYGEARDGGKVGEYSAIFYDHRRLDLLHGGTFWLSDTPAEPSASWGNTYKRICTWAHFQDLATGKHFYTYNTHLDHQSAKAREHSVKLIVDRIAAREIRTNAYVLMGDLNAEPASTPITYLLDNKRAPLVDGMRILQPDEKPIATFHGFEGGTKGPRIDYIFTSAGIRMTAAEVDRSHKADRYPSDHYPVVATISFE